MRLHALDGGVIHVALVVGARVNRVADDEIRARAPAAAPAFMTLLYHRAHFAGRPAPYPLPITQAGAVSSPHGGLALPGVRPCPTRSDTSASCSNSAAKRS